MDSSRYERLPLYAISRKATLSGQAVDLYALDHLIGRADHLPRAARLPLVAPGTRLSNTSRASTPAAKGAQRRLSMAARPLRCTPRRLRLNAQEENSCSSTQAL